jgi:hypothetical protein
VLYVYCLIEHQSRDPAILRALDRRRKTLQSRHDRLHEKTLDHHEHPRKKENRMDESFCHLTRLLIRPSATFSPRGGEGKAARGFSRGRKAPL